MEALHEGRMFHIGVNGEKATALVRSHGSKNLVILANVYSSVQLVSEFFLALRSLSY
jgi:hypothetical protein